VKKTLKILSLIAILIIGFAALGAYFTAEIVTPLGGEVKQTVTISSGTTAAEVAEILQQKNLIRHAYAFRLLCKLSKAENRILAGTYLLSSEQTPFEILALLLKGRVSERWVTFPEGLTLRQMEKVLIQEKVLDSPGFAAYAAQSPYEIKEVVKGKGVEGYLFPDTYKIPEYFKASDIINMMLKRFEEVVLPVYAAHKGNLPAELNQMVIIASLVEREAKVPAERPLIAAVYYNRIKQAMRLECDATVQYLLDEVKENLTFEDLKIDSPYNTYKYSGLPPGPICNPGKAALEAAMSPAKVSYLYYVLNAKKNDGHHIFSRDYNAHLRAIETYQK
jgi:UPF0755 protein